MVEIVEIHQDRSRICQDVLDDLPEWFGIEEAKSSYVAAAAHLPMFAGYVEGRAVGFVSLKIQTRFAIDLYVLGVRRDFHRRGIGKALVDAAAVFSRQAGASFLTVKTLAPSSPDRNYAATRSFYEAVGFMPIEILPGLWGDENPCLLMLKSIAPN